MRHVQYVLLTTLVLPMMRLASNATDSSTVRIKRALIFPRGNPTRHQLVAGLGIPVDVVLESITVGYVFKAVYFLPWNSSHWVPQFLRRDEDLLYEPQEVQQRNFVEVERVHRNREEFSNDFQDNWAQRSRWEIYRMLEAMAEEKGYNGRSCLLRTICEAAEAKFSHSSGVLGELLHILFTPSTTDEPTGDEADSDYEEYKRAENLVYHHSPLKRTAESSICSDMYAECPFSLLDFFSGIL